MYPQSILALGLRWQDIIDIIFVSYIVFRFYVIFKGTHVLRVLGIIAFLFVIQRISVLLGLVVTSWVIQGITAASALIIIVLFTREIRSVFQARNLKLLFWGFKMTQEETPCEVIAEVAFEFAREKTGALIILQGREDLTGVIQKNIAWDGKVSKEMLATVFQKKSPVHDGAVIIRGDRLTDVGVILPLSSNPNLPSYFGTRHRAALGLTEVTDALVVVVSEERGVVSVAKAGEITPVNQKEVLVHILKRHLGITGDQRAVTKGLRLEISLAAVLSFALITGIWFTFTKGYDTVLIYDVPIEYTNRDTNLEIVRTSASLARVELMGSGAIIKSIKPDQISVRIDLSQATPGRAVYTISKENVTLPPGVKLMKVIPQYVEVSLDERVEKNLPVQVDWQGILDRDISILDVIVEPPVVKVMGVKEEMEEIHTIYTEKISVENIKSDTELSAKLLLNPASLRLAPGQKERVTVKVKVARKADFVDKQSN